MSTALPYLHGVNGGKSDNTIYMQLVMFKCNCATSKREGGGGGASGPQTKYRATEHESSLGTQALYYKHRMYSSPAGAVI